MNTPFRYFTSVSSPQLTFPMTMKLDPNLERKASASKCLDLRTMFFENPFDCP